ncbi:MAG: glycosylase, partial [Flavisolibacter sp.]
MKSKFVILASILLQLSPCFGQQRSREVSAEKMNQVYREVKTPYKYGLVLVPQNDDRKIDCPTVFRKGGTWYMSYLQFDGRGYETWLAKSKDLLHWEKMGRLMSHSSDTTQWDASQKAGYVALVDTKWGGDYALKKYNGKYWMSYFGGREKGYEAGLLSLGMAYTEKDPTTVHEWTRLSHPILSSHDSDVRWWENTKQFKSTVIYDKTKTTGYPFVIYYNANGDTAKDNKKTRWFERIGMAV